MKQVGECDLAWTVSGSYPVMDFGISDGESSSFKWHDIQLFANCLPH